MPKPRLDRGSRHRIEAGQTLAPVYLASCPASIAASPGQGGSLLVEYTLSPRQLIENDQALWHAWPAGSVTEPTVDALLTPVIAIRATAQGADGFIEIVE